MLVYDSILPHVPVFALVFARLAGLFIFAPVLGSPIIPVRIKVLLSIAMAAAVYASIDLHREVPMRLDLVSLAPAMLLESLLGIGVGMIASLPLVAAQMGGLLMGQQMGLGLGSVYNPTIDTEVDIVGQILFYLALAVFLVMGGLDRMVGAVVGSFARVPLGGFAPEDTPLDLMTGLLASGFELASRVAAPVLCVILLETIAVGLIMKTAPQINILSFGFPVRILLAAAALYGSLAAVDLAITTEIEDAMRLAVQWAVEGRGA